MANKPGAYGRVGENGVLAYLRQHLWPAAERRRLMGTADKGDINPGGYPVPSVVVEVKNAAKLEFSGWLKEAEEERINAGAEIGLVWAKKRGISDAGKWYVMMTGETAVKLLKKAGYGYGESE